MQEKTSGGKPRAVEEIFPLAQYSPAQKFYSRAFSLRVNQPGVLWVAGLSHPVSGLTFHVLCTMKSPCIFGSLM